MTVASGGQLAGKGALITGGTSGIGLAIAERFLAEGAAVVITGRDRALGQQAEASLRRSGQTWFVPADAGDPVAVTESTSAAADFLGGIDVLVNNAGIGVQAGLLG
ncbi:MAG TPA: SDR family NAD(P)-dependent oxidoreductase, partial [Streptosporangiaceae bacterium]